MCFCRPLASRSRSIDARRKWNRFAACQSTGSLNGRRLERSPRRERAVAFFSLSLCLPPSETTLAAATAANGAVSAMAFGVKEPEKPSDWEAPKIRHCCGFKCLSPRATDPLFWSGSRVRCLTLSRINSSQAAKIQKETPSGGWT